ncbi:hypothetical protein EJD97_022990 [Solanum chilense]|uniref:Retrotransposon Copia-like N-terminal domain-containing protein n=1 Tax=Solanum chilense TaxID=4083 RepID=A0A6N2AWU2_SOLCI|nr:hypothetical protein EJD97_022990 [Solanum chilense]
MRVALLGRNKLGMVDGSCKKEVFPEHMGSHWERVNVLVLSWLMNTVEKGLLGGKMYNSYALEVWDDLYERFNKIDGSRACNLHKQYATLSQGASPASSSSNLDMAMFTRNDFARYKKNYNLQSEFYKMKGHTKDVCYKLVGYPSDFNKFIKKGVQTWNNGYNSNARAHNVMTDQLQASEQCDMMGDPFENIAEQNKEDHKDINLLDKPVVVSRGIYLHNGAVAKVTHAGHSNIIARTSLTNVFQLPRFKFNFIFVSKLTKELGCSVSFFPDFCLFKDISNGMVRQIGREENQLYILTRSTKVQQPQLQNNGCVLSVKGSHAGQMSKDVKLWHKRQGMLL